MSRWFPDSVVLRLGDAPRSLVTSAAAPASGSGESPLAAGGPGGVQKLESMLSVFERELDERALKRGTRLTCVVAGDAVRYRIVPWNDELASPAQRQVFAEHCFNEAYGDAARDWTVRHHTAGYAAAALGCALDTALLDRLHALAQARRLRLVQVQPSLMHAYNRAHRHFDSGLFWFVCIDVHWTTLLLMSPTQPLQVKVLPTPGIDLARALDREWFALGMEVPRCPVHVCRSGAALTSTSTSTLTLAPPPARNPSASNWTFSELPGVAASPVAYREAA